MKNAFEIDEIVVSDSPGEMRAALLSEGRLVELLLSREGGGSLVGNVYLGRIGKAAAGADAHFIALGHGCQGFLPRKSAKGLRNAEGRALARAPSEGEAVITQVSADAHARKGPLVTADVALAGHLIVLMPTRSGLALSRRIGGEGERKRLEALLAPALAEGEGVVLRTVAAGAEASALLAELARLREAWRHVLARAASAAAPALLHAEVDALERALRDYGGSALGRVISDGRETLARAKAILARQGSDAVALELYQGRTALFAEREIEEQIAQALEREVRLPSGGSLVIDELEALTAIDVNTAQDAGGASAEATELAVNLEAAAEIARQLRLRNLAGLVVVDFLHMRRASARARVARALAEAVREDQAGVELAGFTSLGLFELTRRRGRAPLSETLSEACESCRGGGRLPSAATVAYEVLRAVEREARARGATRLRVVAAAAVIRALEGEALAARRRLEAKLAAPLELSAAPGHRRDEFEVLAEAPTRE